MKRKQCFSLCYRKRWCVGYHRRVQVRRVRSSMTSFFQRKKNSTSHLVSSTPSQWILKRMFQHLKLSPPNRLLTSRNLNKLITFLLLYNGRLPPIPEQYPSQPPQVRFLIKIFHINVHFKMERSE